MKQTFSSLFGSSKGHWLEMVIILLVAISLRLYFLEADAPLDLSPTQELNLDGPVTIGSARNKAIFGVWEPYPSPLKPHRLYPAMNWLAYGFFELLGTGYWQANFISVVTGLLSIAFMTAFAREQFGRRVSLLTALFLATNYVYIIYNRDPMAYTTVAGGMALSLYCWGRGLRQPAWFFISGLVTMFNALFIKLPGIAFLPAAFLGFLALIWHDRRLKEWRTYVPAVLFGTGVLLVSGLWYWFYYLPDAHMVSQAYYARTFSPRYSLVENVRFAVQSLLLFGVDFGFALRLLPLFLLAVGYLFYRAGQLLSRHRPTLSASEVVALSFLASTAVMLLFSAIRPLRYQILLIPLMSLVAAMALDAWLRTERVPLPKRFGRLYPVFVQMGLTYILYQLLAALLLLTHIIVRGGGPVAAGVALEVMELYRLLVISLLLAIVGTMIFLWRVVQVKRYHVTLPSSRLRWRIALLIVLLTVGSDLTQYWTWARAPQFSIVEASRQVEIDFDASTTVLGGTYAHTLALENELPAVWFYGETAGEAILASPFTHLAVEVESPLIDEYPNDRGIRENLPDLMAQAVVVKSYTVRQYLVSVYEIER